MLNYSCGDLRSLTYLSSLSYYYAMEKEVFIEYLKDVRQKLMNECFWIHEYFLGKLFVQRN